MGLASLIGKTKKVRFIVNNNDVIVLDASVKEDHSRRSPATKLPVENGQTVSDNIIVEPFSLSITGIISDTPIGGTTGLLTEVATTVASYLTPPLGLIGAAAGISLFKSLTGSSNPSIAAYGQLLLLQAGDATTNPPSYPQPVDVFTTLYYYPSMWIEEISAPRDSGTGNVLEFTVKLSQLLLVQPQTVNVSVFANPSLSANLADQGEKSGLPNGFADGKSLIGKIAGVK